MKDTCAWKQGFWRKLGFPSWNPSWKISDANIDEWIAVHSLGYCSSRINSSWTICYSISMTDRDTTGGRRRAGIQANSCSGSCRRYSRTRPRKQTGSGCTHRHLKQCDRNHGADIYRKQFGKIEQQGKNMKYLYRLEPMNWSDTGWVLVYLPTQPFPELSTL